MLPKVSLPLLIVIIHTLHVYVAVSCSNCPDCSDHSSTKDVLATLGKLLDYVQTDYEYMNMDGLFGLRVCEGMFHYSTTQGWKVTMLDLMPVSRERSVGAIRGPVLENRLCKMSNSVFFSFSLHVARYIRKETPTQLLFI
jgi:hypothetical protein